MFAFEHVAHTSLDASLFAAAAPTREFLVVNDPRFTRMVSPFMTVYETDTLEEPPMRVRVVSEAHVAFLMYDEFFVPLEVLAQYPNVGWCITRIALSAISRALVDAVDTHGMSTEPCDNHTVFIDKFRGAVSRMLEPSRPRVMLGELECQASITYTDALAPFAYMLWLERLSLSRLRLESGKILGWGLMLFTMEDTCSPRSRYGHDSAFTSVGTQWFNRILADSYGGNLPSVRTEIFSVKAIESIRRGMRWMGSYRFNTDTIVREMEFTQLITLGSPSSSVVEAAMRFGMFSIVQGIKELVSLRRLMGNTKDSETLFGFLKRLRQALVSSTEAWDMATLLAVEGEVSLRIKFCDLEENKVMTDKERVDYLVSLRTMAIDSSDKSNVSSVKKVGDGIEETKGTLTADDLYEYHTSEAFESANQTLTKLIDQVNVPKSTILRAVLRLGQWQLSQFIVGKLQLSGHKIYARLSPFRCEWGWGDLATVDSEIGLIMGQELMRGEIDFGKVHDDHLAVTLSKRGVVRAFINGTLSTLIFENAFLIQYHKSRSNVTMTKITEDERFTDYQNLDLLIKKVGPICELFGCGPSSQQSSFASLMEACKTIARDTTGMSAKHKRALIFGEFGLRSIVQEALLNAGARLRQLFYNKDKTCVVPMAFITGQPEDHAFLHRLKVQQQATAEQRRRSMIFNDSGEEDSAVEIASLKKENQSTRGVFLFPDFVLSWLLQIL